MLFDKIFTLCLFFTVALFAQDFYVETLDEQKSSDNLLVFRFRIVNNTSLTVRNASLKYCLTKSPGKDIGVDYYHVGNTQVSLENVDSTNVCLNVKMDSIPHGVYPDLAGYSIGVHNHDWSSRNKNLDFSNPQSSAFSKADNVAVYIDDSILYGSDGRIESESDAYLPEAVPLSAFDGISVTLGPNEPYRFAWNFVENAEKYLLTVLREDSSLIHSAEYVTNVADVYLPVGRYLWNVQAINSQKAAKPFSAINNYSRMNLLDFRSSGDGFRIGNADTMISVDVRKDTRLLNITWGELADVRKWDTIHAPLNPSTRPYDEDEGKRCWAVAIYNLNHHFRMANGEKGNLTLDEIVALGHMYEEMYQFYDTTSAAFPLMYGELQKVMRDKKGPALAAFPLNEGGRFNVQSYMLSWALNIPRPKLYDTNEEFQGNQELIARMWIDSLSDGKLVGWKAYLCKSMQL